MWTSIKAGRLPGDFAKPGEAPNPLLLWAQRHESITIGLVVADVEQHVKSLVY